MRLYPCGGCQGLGSHSPRCITQPGSMWRRLADKAEDLGDEIASNDPESANVAYGLAGLFQKRMREQIEAAGHGGGGK